MTAETTSFTLNPRSDFHGTHAIDLARKEFRDESPREKSIACFYCEPIYSGRQKCSCHDSNEVVAYRVSGTDLAHPDQRGLQRALGVKERIAYPKSQRRALEIAHQMACQYYEVNLKHQGDLEDNTCIKSKKTDVVPQQSVHAVYPHDPFALGFDIGVLPC